MAKATKKEKELGYSNEDVLEQVVESEEAVSDIPERFSPEWSNFVLRQFAKNEMIDGAPTCDGLRRVVQVLIGEIISVNTELLSAPSEQNMFTATAKATVTIATSGGGLIDYSDIAECGSANAVAEYAKFPSATAVTRAEGRVYRKMLGLSRIVAAEEKERTYVEAVKFSDEEGPINNTQIAGIKLLTDRLKIDIQKFLVLNDVNEINKATFSKGQELMQLLNEYANKKQVPSAILK